MYLKKVGFIEAWVAHDRDIKREQTAEATKFEQRRVARGILRLQGDPVAIVCGASIVEFTSDLTSHGFMSSQFDERKLEAIKRSSCFRKISGKLETLLAECVMQLKHPITNMLASRWRILNVRAWTTPSGSVANDGMYAFHRDGMPESIFKVMIYFTPMDCAHGSLEIKKLGMLEGPANSWVLFYNSSIKHRGRPGESAERACAEITLARAREFDLALHQPGLNAQWPMRP